LLDIVVAGRCQVLTGPDSVQQPQHPTTFHIYKTRGC